MGYNILIEAIDQDGVEVCFSQVNLSKQKFSMEEKMAQLERAGYKSITIRVGVRCPKCNGRGIVYAGKKVGEQPCH